MQKEFTEDQSQLRDVVSRFLTARSGPRAARTLMAADTGYDRDVWRQACDEVGIAATHIPETCGGFGFGPVELGIVAEEMGRHLFCGPFFSSAVMAGYAVLFAGDDTARDRILPGIASGTVLWTLVLDDVSAPGKVGRDLYVSGAALSGVAPIVVDAHVADRFAVVAGTDDGLALFAIDRDADGVTVTPHAALDPTRKLARVAFDDARVERIGVVTAATLDRIWDHVSVALAHEMIGGAQHLFDSTIEYTRLRYQFGRPIGSFQGLKHRAADLLMELEFAKAATHYAARCLAAGEGERWAASMAKAMASDTYMKAGREAIQMRGGIGFTWEEDTHLWFKRAKSSEVFMGTPDMHRERMMTMIDGESAETGV